MKIILLGVLLMLYNTSAFSTDDATLTAKAVHFVFEESPDFQGENVTGAKGQGERPQTWKLSVAILIRNTSSLPVGVATHPNWKHHTSSPKGDCVTLITEYEGNPWDVRAVVPECDLGVVRLEPGEAAIVQYGEITDKRPPKTIDVKYIVKKDIGERLHLWSGELAMVSQEGKVEK